MRLALVTGPGGCGSTTISALTAVTLARSGSATVLISRDTSMPAVLGDSTVGARPGLTATRPDPEARAGDTWPTIAAHIVTARAAAGVTAS